MAGSALLWLRNDLRLADNPALTAALATGLAVHAIYIEETDADLRARGGASRWWLHRSLQALATDLRRLGIPLHVERGPAEPTFFAFASARGITAAFWNRRYSGAERDIDATIKSRCVRDGILAQSFAANLLVEPWEISTGTRKPYSVYTPFWNALRARFIATPLPAPTLGPVTRHVPIETGYAAPRWTEKLARYWSIGEAAAAAKLEAFLTGDLADYSESRDFPARASTSKLSPHLAFGEIGPRQIWHAAQFHAQRFPASAGAVEKFLQELVWRDFNYHQLFHRTDIARVPMQPRFADLVWRDDPAALAAWRTGRTGIPIVDAGMRELWETGFMQNRVRMLTASLFAKNLLLDWRLGEAWFWDCLVDADPANNPGNWQWVAGSGLDASPFFRIFNPVTQADRFDADGAYIRRWVPELATNSGAAYPAPIVDLKRSRQRALEAFKAL